MNKIDLQARRLVSKALQEGGGAGIELILHGINLEVAKAADGSTAVTSCDIERFDMLGYQDGHHDLRGDLITITSVGLPDDCPPGDYRVTAKEAKGMKWAGWTRGKAEDFLPMEVKCEESGVEANGSLMDENPNEYSDSYATVTFTVAAADEDFVYAYKDIFDDNYPSDEDEQGEEFDRQDWYDRHSEDIGINYGWTDPNRSRRR